MVFHWLDKYRDKGLLILRIGIGLMFMYHGYGKVFGGPEKWVKLGKAVEHLGIHFGFGFWGFMAASSEFFGGLLLALGFFFRPTVGFLFTTMFVAAAMHLGKGDTIGKASHAIEAGILFLSFILIGPGKYSLDEKWHKYKGRLKKTK